MRRVLSIAVVVGMASAACGGVKYSTEDGDYVKLGGRIQLQYHFQDPDDGESTDELKFRRLRPYIEGSVHEDWKGKLQWDMGKGGLAVKDAYFQYGGIENMVITLGNYGFPFSQEFLTSSKKQQLVERTFVGDHNYGTPDRQAGLYVGGHCPEDMFTWDVGAVMGAIDPGNKKLDFDSVVQYDKGDDWNEGPMFGGRFTFHPMGYLKPSQGDFDGAFKASVHLAGFYWMNDDDNLNAANSNDVDAVTGFEVGAAIRGGGFSVDVQYNRFDSELVQSGITDGLYSGSETTLENYAVEGGYMVLPERVELVAGYQVQDADNYGDTWNRLSLGANYFVKKHDIKYQVAYRIGENKDGKAGKDVDEVFVQAQYVF